GRSFVIHWRGDRTNLEDQVFQALTSPITSGQPDDKIVIDRLVRIPGYAPLFKAAFPDEPQPMTLRNIAKAVGAYERTLVTPSPFDAYLAGDQQALPPAAKTGLEKFINTGCVACPNGVGIGGGMYRKFGVVEDYWKATGSDPIDKGRFDVTKALSRQLNEHALRAKARHASCRCDGSLPLCGSFGSEDPQCGAGDEVALK